VVRADPDLPWDDACIREAQADRFGAVELESLAWRVGAADARVVLLRDLGPLANASALAAYPGRTPWVWAATPEGDPRLLPYPEGMELLWKGAAAESVSSVGAGS